MDELTIIKIFDNNFDFQKFIISVGAELVRNSKAPGGFYDIIEYKLSVSDETFYYRFHDDDELEIYWGDPDNNYMITDVVIYNGSTPTNRAFAEQLLAHIYHGE